jgi:hypothetical protein
MQPNSWEKIMHKLLIFPCRDEAAEQNSFLFTAEVTM